ncbi:MAG: META domain-containing protein [Moraxellaceae bacterium]
MRARFFILLALLAGLQGCAALFSASSPALLGTIWQVTELQGEAFVAPGGQRFTLQLQKDGHMRAYAGCDVLTGRFQLKQGWGGEGLLRVGPFDLLERQCAPEIAQLERKVIHAMEGGSRYVRTEAGTLELRNPIAVTLIRFRAQSPAP